MAKRITVYTGGIFCELEVPKWWEPVMKGDAPNGEIREWCRQVAEDIEVCSRHLPYDHGFVVEVAFGTHNHGFVRELWMPLPADWFRFLTEVIGPLRKP